jgi:hypothetical protein
LNTPAQNGPLSSSARGEGHGRVIAPALGHDFQWIRDVDPGIDVVNGNALAAGVTLQPDCTDRLGGLDAHGLSRR